MAGGDDALDPELADLREVAHLGDHQLEDARRRAFVDARPPGDQQLLDRLGAGPVGGGGLLDAGLDLGAQEMLDHRLQQFFLAGEIQVQRALGDAGGLGHLLAARGGEALLDEQRQRRLEQLGRASLLATAAEQTGVGGKRGHLVNDSLVSNGSRNRHCPAIGACSSSRRNGILSAQRGLRALRTQARLFVRGQRKHMNDQRSGG